MCVVVCDAKCFWSWCISSTLIETPNTALKFLCSTWCDHLVLRQTGASAVVWTCAVDGLRIVTRSRRGSDARRGERGCTVAPTTSALSRLCVCVFCLTALTSSARRSRSRCCSPSPSGPSWGCTSPQTSGRSASPGPRLPRRMLLWGHIQTEAYHLCWF